MAGTAFKRISNTFQIGTQKYDGMGIASPDTLYLIMLQRRYDLPGGMGGLAHAGLIGGLIIGIYHAVSLTKKTHEVRTCAYAQLDPGIRSHPDWPFRGKPKHDDKQVLVVPRDAVDLVEHPHFSNVLKFTLAETPVVIEYLLFQGSSIRDYLVTTGWPVRWAGQVLTGGQ